jgi:hypothetical protein
VRSLSPTLHSLSCQCPHSYDYRLRQPSKEISGTWPIMRTRALTESARINEAIVSQRLGDSIGGGRWTTDQRYGNPASFTPLTTGDTFRQASPLKWLGSPGSSKGSPTAPPSAGSPGARKWRGGFATNFPPRTAPAEPLGGQAPWLHHMAPFEDRFHETVSRAGHAPTLSPAHALLLQLDSPRPRMKPAA